MNSAYRPDEIVLKRAVKGCQPSLRRELSQAHSDYRLVLVLPLGPTRTANHPQKTVRHTLVLFLPSLLRVPTFAPEGVVVIVKRVELLFNLFHALNVTGSAGLFATKMRQVVFDVCNCVAVTSRRLLSMLCPCAELERWLRDGFLVHGKVEECHFWAFIPIKGRRTRMIR